MKDIPSNTAAMSKKIIPVSTGTQVLGSQHGLPAGGTVGEPVPVGAPIGGSEGWANINFTESKVTRVSKILYEFFIFKYD